MNKRSAPPTIRDLKREIEAATVLREQIAVLAQGDEDFVRDVIEGETSIHEIIAALVADDAADEAMLDGLKALVAKLKARAERIEHRVEYRRSLIASGLEIAGLPKLATPGGTASLRPTAPKVIVTDESLIPSRFWKASDPKLDKVALKSALVAAEAPIPGAEMSNGGTTLEIRRS